MAGIGIAAAGGAVAEIGLNPACAVALTGTGLPIGLVAGGGFDLSSIPWRYRSSLPVSDTCPENSGGMIRNSRTMNFHEIFID